MGASHTWIAVNALLATMLACNVPAVQRPVQPPDLAGTITAQAMIMLQPSSTAISTAAAHFTELPSLTPAQAFTSTPSVPQISVTGAANCRSGPGAAYELLLTMQPGQTAEVVGKDTAGNYWIIKMSGGRTCWLRRTDAAVSGNVDSLPEVAPPAPPTPSKPASPSSLRIFYRCSLSSSPFLHNDVHVELAWQDNATDEQGYYVSRDGALLATLDANVTSFTDETTMLALIRSGRSAPHITCSIHAFSAAGT